MNRAVLIECLACGIEVVGVLDVFGFLRPSNQVRPDGDERTAGYCLPCYEATDHDQRATTDRID